LINYKNDSVSKNDNDSNETPFNQSIKNYESVDKLQVNKANKPFNSIDLKMNLGEEKSED